MWFFWPLMAAIIAAFVGGSLAGGIYTIVFIPLAFIALITLFVAWLWGRSTGAAGAGTTSEPVNRANTLPRTRGDSGGHVPASPEQLADLRRERQ
jgi:hypothetical protein